MTASHDPHPELTAAKAQARAHAVAVRRLAHADYGKLAAEKLAIHLNCIPFAVGTVVAGYWPMGDEIDPLPLLEALGGRGCTLALPVVSARGQPLTFRAWSMGEALEPGPHGTNHPLAAAPMLIPQVLLVPLLAFDMAGFRLGYGGGYYDRTLDQLRRQPHVTAIGVAFAAQRVGAVPRGPHDQPLDLILTENGPLQPENA